MVSVVHTFLLFACLSAAPPAVVGPAAPGPAAPIVSPVVLPAAENATVHLALDYSEHPTFTAAILRSLAPEDLRANAGAVGFNAINPLTPVRYVVSLMVLEAQRQIAASGKVSLDKMLADMKPAALATGYVGAQVGELTGAIGQSLMCEALGPVGGAVGFLLRPVLWYVGSSIGQQIGLQWGQGGHPISSGIATALRDFNPARDSLQMIGDSLGAVVGQALIPIPLVGAMAGGIVGGVTGLVGGQALLATGSGKAANAFIQSGLDKAADSVDGGAPQSPTILPSIAPQPPSTDAATAHAALASSYGHLIDAAGRQDTSALQSSLSSYQGAYTAVRAAGQ